MLCEIAVCWYVNVLSSVTIQMGLGGKCGQCRVWIVRIVVENAECRKCGERKMPSV